MPKETRAWAVVADGRIELANLRDAKLEAEDLETYLKCYGHETRVIEVRIVPVEEKE